MRKIELIFQKLKNKENLSKEDANLLRSKVSDEDNSEIKKLMHNHWDELCDDDDLTLSEPDDLFYKIFFKTQETELVSKKKDHSIGWWIQRAAAILLLPLIVYIGWNKLSNNDVESYSAVPITIESPLNTKTRFALPDGSVGWLQSGSNIQYVLNEDNQRTINLQGEAFFDVVKNDKQPFIVKTDYFKVKVLGTRFNVQANNKSPTSKVYLEEGSIEMLGINNEHHALLKPGEAFVYNKLEQNYTVDNEAKDENLAWTKGILLLKNSSLKEAVSKMEQFYDVTMEIADKELETLPVYAKIENERLEEVLELTKMILPIRYKIEPSKQLKDGSFTKRKVVIYKNQ